MSCRNSADEETDKLDLVPIGLFDEPRRLQRRPCTPGHLASALLSSTNSLSSLGLSASQSTDRLSALSMTRLETPPCSDRAFETPAGMVDAPRRQQEGALYEPSPQKASRPLTLAL